MCRRRPQVCLVRVYCLARSRRAASETPCVAPWSQQSILNDEKGWKPSVTVKQILTGIQELLDTPNNRDAAQEPAWRLYDKDQAKYILRIKEEVRKYTPAPGTDVVL